MRCSISFISSLCLILFISTAEAVDMKQLLEEVKRHQLEVTRVDREREKRFIANQNESQRLLTEAKGELARLKKQAATLKNQFEANQKTLADLEDKLQASSGILGEIVGTVQQAAGDLKADIKQSLVSSQYPNRVKKLSPIADSTRLPTLDQLNTLWYLLLQEMAESGKVVKFQARVLDSEGNPQQTEVVRIGVFNALAYGRYLRYLPETGELIVLPRQPQGKALQLAKQFMAAKEDKAAVAIDPSRGVLLDLLIHTPDWWERTQQGGIIGYIILTLGLGGLAIVIARLIYLTRMGGKVETQLSELDTPRDDNPLGRILKTTLDAKQIDPESLEALLDEAILKEIPPIERGQSLVKLLTAVAPLLGLLGTVTGMIQTFQSISLFGTGDPKLMAGGISQALVTTMLGLAVAIPLLFLHSLLVNRSRTLIQILEEQSAGLISAIIESRHRE